MTEETNNRDKNVMKECGIIMPISSMNDYTESHWVEVKDILTDTIQDADFEAKMVSESDDIGVIHRRIVRNIYDNPMIVCDISGQNANVMFELGLRLAFDKPTIIVKDDATSYSFDTSIIEHLTYPRDLRYQKIGLFRKQLKEKIINTYQKFMKDPSTYSTFLKNFGTFEIPKIDQDDVPPYEYIIEELSELRKDIKKISSKTSPSYTSHSLDIDVLHNELYGNLSLSALDSLIDQVDIPTYSEEGLNQVKNKALSIDRLIRFTATDHVLTIHFKEPITVKYAVDIINQAGIYGKAESVNRSKLLLDTIPF